MKFHHFGPPGNIFMFISGKSHYFSIASAAIPVKLYKDSKMVKNRVKILSVLGSRTTIMLLTSHTAKKRVMTSKTFVFCP